MEDAGREQLVRWTPPSGSLLTEELLSLYSRTRDETRQAPAISQPEDLIFTILDEIEEGKEFTVEGAEIFLDLVTTQLHLDERFLLASGYPHVQLKRPEEKRRKVTLLEKLLKLLGIDVEKLEMDERIRNNLQLCIDLFLYHTLDEYRKEKPFDFLTTLRKRDAYLKTVNFALTEDGETRKGMGK